MRLWVIVPIETFPGHDDMCGSVRPAVCRWLVPKPGGGTKAACSYFEEPLVAGLPSWLRCDACRKQAQKVK